MKNIAAKLVKILATVEKVKKTGYNSHQKYHYATEADILDAIRQGLIENQVFITESSKVVGVMPIENAEGKKSFLTTVETQHTFLDADSGESITVTSSGQGHDNQDKGVYKAITGATKYFYLKNFMVSTGDDPEADGTKKPAPSKSQPQQTGGFKMGGAKPAPTASTAKPQQAQPTAEDVPKSANSKWGFDKAGKNPPQSTTKKAPEVLYDDTESDAEAQDYEGEQDDPGF